MKNYLSFGGGVNSVALHLMMIKWEWDFESVFVNHGTDWPETYEYLNMFQEWLDKKGYKPITILKPNVEGFNNLYDYCFYKKIFPSKMFRWCTDKFKIKPLTLYFKKPCFNNIGIDIGEEHRASINAKHNIENRYPLLETDKNRNDCIKIIKQFGLKVPMKSGCFICPYQKFSAIRNLRIKHPDLFCKIEKLENLAIKQRRLIGKRPIYIFGSGIGIKLKNIVEEDQYKLFKRDEYPPCNCML